MVVSHLALGLLSTVPTMHSPEDRILMVHRARAHVLNEYIEKEIMVVVVVVVVVIIIIIVQMYTLDPI
jgi:hypothetical protein